MAHGGDRRGGEPSPPVSPLQKRIDWLGEVRELNPSQRLVLGLLARIARAEQVRKLVGAINQQGKGSEEFDLSELRPVLHARVDRRDLSGHGLLTRFGLIEKDDNDNFRISDLVGAMLSRKRLAAEQIRAFLLGKPTLASLGSDDFAHLGELRDLATQVNEMLTQMERRPYPFACTTNAPDLLDPATARRFLFKVRFLPMTGEQIATAFRRTWLCASSSANGGHGVGWLGGSAEIGLLVLPEVVHVEVAVGFEPVLGVRHG